MNCPNCDEIITGRYCSNCGQPAEVPRITWRYLLDELQTRLFGFDNKFLRTLRDLTIRPERVIGTVIEGVKVRYFGPLSYYFLLITVYVLLMSFLEVDMTEFTRPFAESISGETTTNQQTFQDTMNQRIFSNFRIFSFFMVPFFILGTFIFFRNKGYNFLETSVLVFYGMGHPILLSILALFTYKLGIIHSASIIVPLVSYLYFSWICARFYKGNAIWNFVKGTLAMILSMLLLMFLVVIIITVYAIIDPTFRQTME